MINILRQIVCYLLKVSKTHSLIATTPFFFHFSLMWVSDCHPFSAKPIATSIWRNEEFCFACTVLIPAVSSIRYHCSPEYTLNWSVCNLIEEGNSQIIAMLSKSSKSNQGGMLAVFSWDSCPGRNSQSLLLEVVPHVIDVASSNTYRMYQCLYF